MTQILNQFLDQALVDHVFPNAELLVVKQGRTLFHKVIGVFQNSAQAKFDLASLTKPLCVSFLCMIFSQKKMLDVNQKVSDFFETKSLQETSLKSLLNHTSGLVDWVPFYMNLIDKVPLCVSENRQKILESILFDDNFMRLPGKVVYSDLGYILLGACLEKMMSESLDVLFKQYIARPLGLEGDIFYIPLSSQNKILSQHTFLPTENCPVRKRVIEGEVMDRNAFVMGGVSGHAGLFANALAVNRLLIELRAASLKKSKLISHKTFQKFCLSDPHRVFDLAYFTLGFDTPTEGVSQAGSLFSKNSIGHLGYAGTSFWWDLERDHWVIFLSNRCMPDRTNMAIQKWRPQLHDLVVRELL